MEKLSNEEVLNAFANKMLSAVDGIEAFGKEQIPDYIEQVLMYNFWESVGYLTIFSIFGSILFLAGCYGWYKHSKNEYGDWEFLGVFGCALGSLMLVFAISFNFPDALKIKLAPKVYIVDYIRTQIK